MFRKVFVTLFAVGSLLGGISAAEAAGGEPPYHDTDRDSFEVGLEGQWYQYREPNFVRTQGVGYGLLATYTYTFNNYFLVADILADFYNLSYSSNGTGSENNITDYKQDYRGLFGHNFAVSHAVTLRPYIGIGYRLLFDANGTNITSTGAAGYDRRSQYLYVPVGLSANIHLGRGLNKWLLRPTAEYDYLLQGWQTSYLSDRGFDNNLNNTQNVGYGLRASFMVTPPLDFFNFSIGPYLRYWSIHDSDVQTLYFQGTPVGSGLEPGNNTLEYGLMATLRF